MFSLIPFFLFAALAGRVFAFTSLTVGNSIVQVPALVDIPDSAVKTACNTVCTATTANLQACGTNTSCLCNNSTVQSLLTCEQCMFTDLINTNKPKPDFRAGSTPVLSAYSAACKAENFTLTPAQTALKLPPTWDGPFVAVLPVGQAVVTVSAGALLGFGALFMLSNI